MRKALTFLSAIMVFIACTKQTVVPPVPEEKPDEEEPTPEPTPKDSVVEYYYTTETFRSERKTHYFASDVNQQFFLGSIWHLKDSSDNVYLEPLRYSYTPFDMIMYSYWLNVPIEAARPSYESMRNYAKKHQNSSQSDSYVSHRATFSDYTEIKRWLPHNVDVDAFLDLARVSDSTVIRKPTGVVFRTEIGLFSFAVDIIDVYEHIAPHLEAIQATGQSPYLVHSVFYGKQLVVMAESDSTYAQVSSALEKLLNDNQALTPIDEATLATSRVLLYCRTGGKESLIEQAIGLQNIKTSISTLNREWRREDNKYDYPLYYIASNLIDGSTLQYDHSFDYLQKRERLVEK